MKKLVAVAIAIAIAFFGTAVIDSVLGGDESAEERIQEYLTGTSDREFVSAEGRFRATFPGKPERATENVESEGTTIPVVAFAREFEDAGFSVAIFEWPTKTPFDFDAGVNGIAAESKAKVQSSTKVKVQGFDAVEYVLAPADGTFAKGLVIRARARVYQLEVSGKANPPAGYDKFKGSFQITQ